MKFVLLNIVISCVLLTGCAVAPPYPWVEVQVTVRYLDIMVMQELARDRGIQRQVEGFHDKGAIYCPYEESPKAFLVCGHELWHAVKGGFHQ